MERLDQFRPKQGFGVTGSQADEIAKVCAEVFGEREIRINVPYSDFNIRGKATDVARETIGVMPFSKAPIKQSDVTTMFYGDRPISRCSFLPIWAECDVFFIKSINEGEIVEINLTKAPSWRTYL